MNAVPTLAKEATIAVITALPKEHAAVRAVLGSSPAALARGRGPLRVDVASVASNVGGEHTVVLALLPDMGTVAAAGLCKELIQACERLRHVLMVGIAGAVPDPGNPERHVRLGDIVVSDGSGVVQFDFGKLDGDSFQCRSPSRPPGVLLLDAVRQLLAGECGNQRPWEDLIARILGQNAYSAWRRPRPEMDVLLDDPANGSPVVHPVTVGRRDGHPMVFVGPIGSSNALIKNAQRRDELRAMHRVLAIEMEGAGIADACLRDNLQYLIVRGTCDYCNATKGDIWQAYAALVAAAFCRCVLEELPPSTGGQAPQPPMLGSEIQTALADVRESEGRSEFIPAKAVSTAMAPELGTPDDQSNAPPANTLQVMAPPGRPLQETAVLADQHAMSPAPGPAPSAPTDLRISRTAEIVVQEGRRIRDRLDHLFLTLAREAAYDAAEEALAWMDSNAAMMPEDLYDDLIDLLVRIECRRARQAASGSEKPDMTRAKALLERATHGR